MKYIIAIIAFGIFTINQNYAMEINPNPQADTLILKGRIVKADMKDQKGAKLEGVQDYYFSTSTGGNSYFIKTAVGNFSKSDLDKYCNNEITVQCVKKFGNIDIGPEDPSYAATRVGEYIVILKVMED